MRDDLAEGLAECCALLLVGQRVIGLPCPPSVTLSAFIAAKREARVEATIATDLGRFAGKMTWVSC